MNLYSIILTYGLMMSIRGCVGGGLQQEDGYNKTETVLKIDKFVQRKIYENFNY